MDAVEPAQGFRFEQKRAHGASSGSFRSGTGVESFCTAGTSSDPAGGRLVR